MTFWIASMTLQWSRTLLRVTKFERTFFGKGLNLPAPLDIQWPKMLSASGGFAPLTHWPVALPLTPLGALPPEPPIGSCSVVRTRHGAPNHFRRLWSYWYQFRSGVPRFVFASLLADKSSSFKRMWLSQTRNTENVDDCEGSVLM